MEQPNIFMSYLRVTQHMSQQFRSHFGRLDLDLPWEKTNCKDQLLARV